MKKDLIWILSDIAYEAKEEINDKQPLEINIERVIILSKRAHKILKDNWLIDGKDAWQDVIDPLIEVYKELWKQKTLLMPIIDFFEKVKSPYDIHGITEMLVMVYLTNNVIEKYEHPNITQ